MTVQNSLNLGKIAQDSNGNILLNNNTFVGGQLTAFAKLETRLSEHGLNIQPWSESTIQSARLDIWANDSSKNYELSFFRDSYSSSYAWLSVYVPNRTDSVNCSIGANGNSYFSVFAGNVGIGLSNPTDKLHVKSGYAKFEGGIKLTSTGYSMNYGSAAPTSGTYKRGDIVFNSSPSAGGFIGWVCVAAGTPGTWKTWGAISA